MSVIVFLRDDIYDTLRFEDKNKITETSMARVEWDTLRTRWTLRDLMGSRFRASLEDTMVSWENLFDESKEMSGHQSKYQLLLTARFFALAT